ncbi:shikimate kinase [Brumimicrobium oceani]|uniref:Shikimate kinase n=1 Tax=Brumimicrobium oceani TaxID=2100725 RepID=A0A2U2XG85_9FLAO|nr:shikimate kinase [Brumimicrobium oceani]PWH86767.1 shikimate kinase [Brumimicrobium oceani]
MQNNRIFLIGFMGVGKTSIGKRLANKLNIPFVDLDQEIEKKFKISINEFFSKYGELSFRKEETKMLLDTIHEFQNAIISVGGGLPCFNQNMKTMNNNGVTCYLHRPPKELFHRLVNSKSERPLLKDLNDDQLLEFIENKVEEREAFYNQAKIVFNRDEQELDSMIKVLKPLI